MTLVKAVDSVHVAGISVSKGRNAVKASFPLRFSATSEPFTITGPWELHTLGVWFGQVRLESKQDEGDRWSPARSIRAMGDRNASVMGSAASLNGGSSRYYRFVFRKSRTKQRNVESSTDARLELYAHKVTIDA